MLTYTETLVSIVIPTFGRANFLERSLNSAINQTYKNIEIIVVNDNNENTAEFKKTTELLEKFLKFENRLLILNMKKNSGGAVARNKGAAISRGKYLCFLDDDDEFHPKKISQQLKKIENSTLELSVVGGFANIINEENKLIRIEQNERKGLMYKEQLKNNVCTTSIAMIKADIFKKVGGFDDVRSSQEHRLFIKIFQENPNYDYVADILVNINHHSGERISNGKGKVEGAIKLFDYVKEILNKHPEKFNEFEVNEIKKSHYKNIIRAYMQSDMDRKKAVKYLMYLLMLDKKLNLKYILIILLGFPKIDRIKRRIKKI